MAGNTDNARIWLLGDVYVAPVGSTAPTDVATAWGTPWVALGLVSEDGLGPDSDMVTNDFFGWNGFIRSTDGKFKPFFKFTALEDNDTVFKLANPGSTSATVAGLTTRNYFDPTRTTDPRAFGIETTDGVVTRRLIVPKARARAKPQPYKNDALSGYEFTVDVSLDSSGKYQIELNNDAGAAAPAA